MAGDDETSGIEALVITHINVTEVASVPIGRGISRAHYSVSNTEQETGGKDCMPPDDGRMTETCCGNNI
jgi:hypothetical protein